MRSHKRTGIGISSYAYRWAVQLKRLDLNSILDRARRNGAEVVQILDNLPLESSGESHLSELRQRATDAGLTVEVGMRGSQPERLRKFLNIAERLEARVLRVVLSSGGWNPPFAEYVRIFQSLLPEVHRTGVTIAIENHFELSPKDLVGLVTEIDDPVVCVCLDPVNSISRLVGSGETVAALAPLAVSVHIKDAKTTRLNTGFYVAGCPLGEGWVDLPGMLEAVSKNGRSPNILVEAWVDRLTDDEATLTQEEEWVRQGLRYLQDWRTSL